MLLGKRLLLALTLFCLCATPALADELLSLKAGYAKLTPKGEFEVSDAGLVGTSIDFDDDLGFDDSEEVSLEVGLQLGAFRLFAAYLPVSFSGNGTLTKSINFSGETFTVGSQVSSDVKLDIYEAGLAWYLVNIDDAPVRVQLGPEIAVKYVDADIKMQADLLDLDESEKIGAPIPTIGLRGRVAMADFLGIAGRVGYLAYDDNSFLDVDAQVELSPLPLVGIFAGYRYLDVDVDEDDVVIDASFDGPYVGALVRF